MTTFSISDGTIYGPDDIDEMLSTHMSDIEIIRTNKKIEYYNVSCAFDIETTSFYVGEEKRAIMYEWTLGLNGAVMVGRTWEEFLKVYDVVVTRLNTWDNRRLIIYIHNAGFEFQFLRKRLLWSKVFSIDERKPIYAITNEGIEFRCSYLLSGYSLAMLGGQLHKYKVEKMVGDLDYTLKRHSETPLTERELRYCVNDVLVVMAYIQESIERDGDITRIPLTKTGYVRNYCRKSCMYDGKHSKNTRKYLNYRGIMSNMQLSPDEYKQLKRAFQGGFTHANAFYSGKTIENVGSYDLTSSYPTVMVAEKFPMSSAEVIEITSPIQLKQNLLYYCCLFDVEFVRLESITLVEHPLSVSRCRNVRGAIEDNGRIVTAEYLTTTLTEQDYFILQKFYRWEEMRIGNFRRYKRGYLPTDFVKAILNLYKDKTELKGVDGKEEEYLRSKEMINSAYGMSVTDICRDEIIYTDEWSITKPDIEKALSHYNKSPKRFLFYPWGVWVTAYARRNLFSAIYEWGTDYIYSDTDSVKGINVDAHKDFIEKYNKNIITKLESACEYHHIDISAIRPKTIAGKEKPLGVWDFEGVYTRFKTLGAKRYMTEKDGKISITVSGVNKKFAVPYLVSTYKDRVFDAFKDGLLIPAEHTGKNTHTYIDEEQSGFLTDYTGNTAAYHEYAAIHLEPCEYSLSLSDSYVDYLKGIREYNK